MVAFISWSCVGGYPKQLIGAACSTESIGRKLYQVEGISMGKMSSQPDVSFLSGENKCYNGGMEI